jgi:hypothetical protein
MEGLQRCVPGHNSWSLKGDLSRSPIITRMILHHHIRERRLVEQHKRARSQSSDGTRDWNGGAYGAVDEGDDQEKSRSFHDQYGRSVPFDVARRIRNGFQQCLPDNPFGVYVEPYTSRPDKDFPDQLLLKFWTWWASLRLVRSTNQAADQTIDLSGLKITMSQTTLGVGAD